MGLYEVTLVVLAVIISQTQAQFITRSGVALVRPVPTAPPESLVVYDGVARNTPGPSVNVFKTDLAGCLQQCINDRCTSFDYNVVIQNPVSTNCQLFNDPATGCPLTATEFTPTADYNHYQLMTMCPITATQVSQLVRVVKFPDVVISGETATPYTRTGGVSGDECGLECSVRDTCFASSSVGGVCNLYLNTDGNLPDKNCPALTDTAGAVSYIRPCVPTAIADQFERVLSGEMASAIPSSASFTTFIGCRTLCNNDADCVGYKFLTTSVFDLNTLDTCTIYRRATARVFMECIASSTASFNEYVVIKSATCPYATTADTRLVGGLVQTGYTNLFDCQVGCYYDKMCVGIDWNKETTTSLRERCWFQYEHFGACLGKRSSTCCDHHAFVPRRCSSMDDYLVFNDVKPNAVGTTSATATNYATCRQECQDSATCEGFDLSGTVCTHYTAAQVCLQFIAATGVMHYRKKTYDCLWPFYQSRKYGGTAQPGVYLYSDCEKICRLNSDCKGFDFNPTLTVPSTTCWIFTTQASICSTLYATPGEPLMHYRIRNYVCPTEEVFADASWANAMQNSHTQNNRLIGDFAFLGNFRAFGEYASAIDCLRACYELSRVRNDACAGVDYDKRTRRCYVAERKNACGAGEADRCCDRLQLKNGCAAPTVSGYTGTLGRHRLDGRLVASNSNPEACGVLCSQNARCQSFDFDITKQECWHHTDTQLCRDVNKIFNHECCDNYVNATYACTSYQIPGFPDFRSRGLRHVIGGTLVPDNTVATEKLCTDYCRDNTDCLSVDFNFDHNTCFYHTATTSCNAENTNNHVHRYIKNNQCPNLL